MRQWIPPSTGQNHKLSSCNRSDFAFDPIVNAWRLYADTFQAKGEAAVTKTRVFWQHPTIKISATRSTAHLHVDLLRRASATSMVSRISNSMAWRLRLRQ
eukprot:1367723-Pleurochrysis_carterae.AAC.2